MSTTLEIDRNEYWLLKHADGRNIAIARRPEHYGLDVIRWFETRGSERLRSGAWDRGTYCAVKPGQELTTLLERFRGEGYELVSIRTRLSATVLRLLRELDALDNGAGVATSVIRNGWQVAGGGRYSKYSFRELDALGVVDVGNGFGDPVKVLPIGRDLARASRKRVRAGSR